MQRQRNATFATLASIAVLSLADCAGDGARDGQPATAEDLRAALTGNTFVALIIEPHNRTSVGETMLVYFGADGVTKMKPEYSLGDEGTWETEGAGRYCTKFRWFRNGLRSCTLVKRLDGDEMTTSTVENRVFTGKLVKGNPHGL